MDIWKAKHRQMWCARLAALNALLQIGMIVWSLAIGAYIGAAVNVGVLAGSVWVGIKAYRFAIARI